MRNNPAKRLAALLSAALLVALVACEEGPAESGDAGLDAGAGLDAKVDAKVSLDSGAPDGGPRPEGVPFDYCAEPFFKLHIGGESEKIMGYSLSGSRLAYNRVPAGTMAFDLYVLELEPCVEYRLTAGSTALAAFIHGSEILYSEDKDFSPAPNYYCQDIYRYDLDLWRAEQLTSNPLCEWSPKTNGRYVAFSRSTAEDGGSPRDYLLWDRVEGTEISFAEPGAQAGYYDLSERWLAWSGYTQLATSIGKDVFARDLETGVDTHLDNSAAYYCYDVRLGGEYLTYVCSEYWTLMPYHLFLRHLPTGEELHLDGAQGDVDGISHGAISSSIVAWNTTKHMPAPDPMYAVYDVELYDIETGIYRRLTTAQSKLRVVDLDVPWITFARWISSESTEYYVGNLERLGVIDADSRLLEGDGVLDPPQ